MKLANYLKQQTELSSGSGKLERETINVFRLKIRKINGARLKSCVLTICPAIDVLDTVFNDCTIFACDLSQFIGCTFLKCSFNLHRSDIVFFKKCRFIRSRLGDNASVVKNVPFRPTFERVTFDRETRRYFLSRPLAQSPNNFSWKGDVLNTIRD